MYQLQLMSLARLASTTSLTIRNASSSRAIVNRACELHASSQSVVYPQHRQTIHTTPSSNKFIISNLISSDNVFNRTYQSINFHLFKKYIYRGKAYLLYSRTCDSLDYMAFMKEFRMPDTFFSWFLITELHVWMIMVRLLAGGQEGMETRKHLVGAMWQDADARKSKLGKISTTIASEMKILGYQFNAAIIGYDEGLMSSDQVLAGAIWRRFLQSECNNPELLENLIIYIRKNIHMLDNIPIDELINVAKVSFIDREKC